MSASPVRALAAVASPAVTQPAASGFLRIVRHGTGLQAIYVLTYHRLDSEGGTPRPVQAEGAQSLLDLLDKIGVDFRLSEVRGAMEDILRFGSANIPNLWLSDDEMVEKGLVES